MKQSKIVIYLFCALSGAALLAACNRNVTPPTNNVQLGLQLGFLNGHQPEITLDSNLFIAGHVNNQYGEAVRGAEVHFTLDPADIGQITPFGTTEPDSASGFRTRVTFRGTRIGVVVIRGYVLGQDGFETTSDTIHAEVKSPING